MDRGREARNNRFSKGTDVRRNRRQASLVLSEVARHHCLQATEELLKESNRLVEESRRLRAKAKKLREFDDE